MAVIDNCFSYANEVSVDHKVPTKLNETTNVANIKVLALLEYCISKVGSLLPAFWDNVSGLSSRVKQLMKNATPNKCFYV